METTVPSSPWRVVSASVRGTSHVRANLPCQDVIRHQTGPGAWLLAALADGAGSASFAEIGAAIAAETALAAIARRLADRAPANSDEEAWRGLLRDAVVAARTAVLAEAERRTVRPRELASTLTLLAIGPELAAAAQIGDGAALGATTPDELVCLARPTSAEYLNETTFLTSDTALDTLQLNLQRGAWRQAVLFCDGLQLLALRLPEATPHGRFFQPLFRFVERSPDPAAAGAELARFLQSPRITERADDDLTLLLAHWCGSAPAGPQATAGPA